MTDLHTRFPRRLRRGFDELAAGGAAALVAAALHLAMVGILRIPFSVYRWEWGSDDLVWKVPLAYGLAFLPFAAALSFVAMLRSGGVPLRVSLTVWIALIGWALLLFFPQIHGVASLLLAIAAATQLSRILAANAHATRRVLRVGSVAFVIVAVAARPLHQRARSMGEMRAFAGMPAPSAGAPNVLFLVWDTVRASSLSLYGAPFATTPHLDSLARLGVTFDDAYSTAPWTLPSHASMFTGQYAGHLGADYAAPLDGRATTLAEALRASGYATAGFTANFMATRAQSGLARGFVRYEDFKSSLEEVVHVTTFTQAEVVAIFLDNLRRRPLRRALSGVIGADFSSHFSGFTHDDKTADEVADSFLDWRAAGDTARPFFAFLNFFDAHAPNRPPERYVKQFGGDSPRPLDRYHAGIRYIDDTVERMLRELERQGVLQNTILIVTSDHGEQFGEHKLTAHGNSLYRQLLHVPLIIVYPPKVPGGVRIRRQVTLRDLAATVLDLTGVARDSTIGGTSLAGTWQAPGTETSEVIAEVERHYRSNPSFRNRSGPMKSLIDDTLHVILDGTEAIEAYAYRRDALEEQNIAASPGASAAFRRLLDDAVARQRLPWKRDLRSSAKRKRAGG